MRKTPPKKVFSMFKCSTQNLKLAPAGCHHEGGALSSAAFPDRAGSFLAFAAPGGNGAKGAGHFGAPASGASGGPTPRGSQHFDPFFYVSDAGEIFASNRCAQWSNLAIPAYISGGLVGALASAGVTALIGHAGGNVSPMIAIGMAGVSALLAGGWLMKKVMRQLRDEIRNHFHGPVILAHESIADLGVVFQNLRVFAIRYAREVGMQKEVAALLLQNPETRLLTKGESVTLNAWLQSMGQEGTPAVPPNPQNYQDAINALLYEDRGNGRELRVVSASLNPFRRSDVERNMVYPLKRVLESLVLIHDALLDDQRSFSRNQIMSHVSNTLGFLSQRFTNRGANSEHALGVLRINNDIMWKNHRLLHVIETHLMNVDN